MVAAVAVIKRHELAVVAAEVDAVEAVAGGGGEGEAALGALVGGGAALDGDVADALDDERPAEDAGGEGWDLAGDDRLLMRARDGVAALGVAEPADAVVGEAEEPFVPGAAAVAELEATDDLEGDLSKVAFAPRTIGLPLSRIAETLPSSSKSRPVRTIVLLQYSQTSETVVPRNGAGAPHSGR